MSMQHRSLTLLVCWLLALATIASATDHLKLKTGKTLVGAATAYDQETNIVTFVTTSNEVLSLKAADLDRLSAYKLAKSKGEKSNAADEIRLGGFACDIDLYAHANRHYGNAAKLDPNRVDEVEQARVKLRASAAAHCMQNAREAMAKNDTHTAEKWLTTLVEKLPREPQAAEAAAILGETYAKNHAAKDDHLEESNAELLAGELRPAKKHYDAMLASIQKGLTSNRASSVAAREYERAWKSGERAMRELQTVEKRLVKKQPDVSAVFGEYRDLVEEHMIEAQLHLASLLTVQTNYNGARKAVDKALAIDPKSRGALAARARIEEAASRGWRW